MLKMLRKNHLREVIDAFHHDRVSAWSPGADIEVLGIRKYLKRLKEETGHGWRLGAYRDTH
jgi:hypothetical protein